MKNPDYGSFPLPRQTDVIKAYIEDGVVSEGFRPILENDLYTSVLKMDAQWLPYLHSVVVWLYTEAPAKAIGSKMNVTLWSQRGGHNGIRREQNTARAKRLVNILAWGPYL